MAAAAAGRCLSDLPDDLLRRILCFAPAREGAATAVLSRRWRWLWRTSGAVNLDSRSVNGRPYSLEEFVDVAENALAAAVGPIRRLTLFVAEGSRINLTPRVRHLEGWSEHSLVDAVVSHPAVRHVEEIQIEVHEVAACSRSKVSFGSLPSEALRVLLLRVSNCSAAPPPGASFPRLAILHLLRCSVSPVDLQAIMDAAPQLSTLHLASTSFTVEGTMIHGDDEPAPCYRLLCPSVTALVFENCRFGYFNWNKERLELEAPRLQYIRFKGHVQYCNLLSLKSQQVIQVDLHLTDDHHARGEDWARSHKSFWQFVQNFSTTKVLKLTLGFTMDDLALRDEASQAELLGGLSFGLLERLELEANYRTSMVMLANLLRCCPRVRELRLKLCKMHRRPWIDSSIEKEAGVDFGKSVNGFRNRKSRSMISLGEENQDKYEVSGIPAFFSEHPFSCLKSHLKIVSLDFVMDEPNCLGVQLAKFFAENATVLEEMYIDDGAQEMQEHVNRSVIRWMANTARDNNQLDAKY